MKAGRSNHCCAAAPIVNCTLARGLQNAVPFKRIDKKGSNLTRVNLYLMVVHLLVLGALGGCAKETETQPETVEVVSAEQASAFARSCMDTARLNAPATPENSYLQDFGYGAILRVPKCLVSNLDYTKLKQPVKFEEIGMTFYYPDMTLKDWSPEKREERTEDSPWRREK